MPEKKKKPRLDQLLSDFESHGGDVTEMNRRASADPNFYGEVLEYARDWRSPEVQTLIRDSVRNRRKVIEATIESYVKSDLQKQLEGKLGKGKVEDHHRHNLKALGDKAIDTAREMVHKTIFEGMAYKWGIDAKDAEKKFKKGDQTIRDQVQTFISTYISPDGQKENESPENYLERVASEFVKEDHVLDSLDSNETIKNFVSLYAMKTDKSGKALQTYSAVAQRNAVTHKGVLKGKSAALAKKHKLELKPDPEASDMAAFYLSAHPGVDVKASYGKLLQEPKKK